MSPPNPPLDPRMLAAIRAAVHEAIAQRDELALGPIKQEIVTLQATDRRHSGTHAGLTEELRKSKPEIAATVEEAVMKRVEAKLDALRGEMHALPAEAVQSKNAAVAALHASNNANANAASAAISATAIRSKQDDQAQAARVRFWATIIPVIGTTLATLYTAIFR